MEIVNRVANSQLITFDLSQYATPEERVVLDLKDVLHEGAVLREKDLRNFTKQLDCNRFSEKWVALHCSADAIVPTWAFMLVAATVSPHAKGVFMGTLSELEAHLYRDALAKIDWEPFRDAAVVVKGCGQQVPVAAYVAAIVQLQTMARSVMYGEACSAVPLFKKPKGHSRGSE